MTNTTILRCPSCKSYGLSEACPCGEKRASCKPPKYSPEDKYGHYRRLAKQQAVAYNKF